MKLLTDSLTGGRCRVYDRATRGQRPPLLQQNPRRLDFSIAMGILPPARRVCQIHARQFECSRSYCTLSYLFLKLLVLVGSSYFSDGKATFIAAVQAQVITYAYQSNSTNLEVAINAIFFTGLFLDIVGGCMAYIVAVQLQHIYALLLRRSTSVSHIVNALDQYSPPTGANPSTLKAVANLPSVSIHILFLEIVFLHALTYPSAWESSLNEMRTSQRSIEQIILLLDRRLHARTNVYLQEYQRTTHELDKSRAAVSIANSAIATLRMIVLVGVACCVVGGLCYVKNAQPTGVWITSFTVLGGISIWFAIIMMQPRVRKV